ncbi:hypothetical protein ABIC83_006193, partial [Roseateles asaccharophilus]
SKGLGGSRESPSASKIIFQKYLTTDAKAVQNPISLLLTTNRESGLIESNKEAESAADENQQSVEKRNFQKYLTTRQKAD